MEALRFRRAPLLAAAICFAIGEVMALNGPPMAMLAGATLLTVLLAMLALRRSVRVAVVPVAGLWMVVGLWCVEVRPVPPTQARLMSYADGLSREVRGRVVRVRALPAPVETKDHDAETVGWWERDGMVGGVADEAAAASGAVSVDVAVEGVEEVTPDVSRMVPMGGGVRATLYPDAGAMPALGCGDVVEGPMRLKIPERYRDPGAWQYADYLLEQGVGVRASLPERKLRVLGAGAASLQCRLYAGQEWAAGRVAGYVRSRANRERLRLTADDAGMLSAMLFGERTGLNHEQRLGFERTGSFHLFVVSGMHVALIAGGVFWAARRLRLREWMATALTLGVTAGYALLTGFGAPVQRALWMTAIFLLARLLSRERSVLNALGAAALGVLVWSPGALFEASFQMTFLAIVAIGGIAVPLGERSFLPWAHAAQGIEDVWVDFGLRPKFAQFRVMLRMAGEALAGLLGPWAAGVPAAAVRWGLWATELALVGVVAETVMVLPMAVYFHRATVFALPANMLSVPVVAVLVPVAVATFTAMLLSPWAAMVPGAVTAVLLHGVTGVIGSFSRVQAGGLALGDLRVPAPGAWVMAGVVGCWVFCVWAVRRSGRWAVVAAMVLPMAALAVLWPERAVVVPGVMEVTAIDVGQGDSLLVVSPEGRTMLVDAGGPVGGADETKETTSRFDVGEEVVAPYLWSRRIRRLDALVLTHAHSDHMGGMPAVLRDLRPRELWVGVDAHSAAFAELVALARRMGVVVRHFRAGDEVSWGGAEVRVLAPFRGYVNGGDPKNDDSLVLRVEFGASSVLLEGDAEAPSERAMVASGRMRPVTLLKVGHHGSRTSTTPEFLAAAAPRDAVVSVGKGNTFGHPRGEVIARIAAARTRLYRTDEFGLTTFLMGRDGGVTEVVGKTE